MYWVIICRNELLPFVFWWYQLLTSANFMSNFVSLSSLSLSLFFPDEFAKGSPMCLSFQITSSWCIDLFCDVLSLFYFALIFILCPLPLVSFVLFPGSFRCKIRLYVWGFSCLLRWACITINFSLRTLLLYTTVFLVCVVFSHFHCLQVFFISSDFFNHTWVVYGILLILHVFLFLEHTQCLYF